MKYPKANLGSIALFVLLGHSDKRDDSRPRDERNFRCRRLAGSPWHSVRGSWHSHKESVGYQFRACELSCVLFSDTANTATEIIEACALGWVDVREVRLRNGQMGSPDYPNALVVWATLPVTRLIGSLESFRCIIGPYRNGPRG